ncbi:hypothetical protein BLL52_0684 [Rhodoferax antarcticus ANT.BR]|uniref:Uncharacterized protein n=1 Tax=Rhodoferax antarcticus ANT.BR TaxID=1111071 RepID=A0A1Q8YJ25_9BURK|nr:hypothetical protein BLL52_0684 [Rhodoferax antarcticus ANT.BR]
MSGAWCANPPTERGLNWNYCAGSGSEPRLPNLAANRVLSGIARPRIKIHISQGYSWFLTSLPL